GRQVARVVRRRRLPATRAHPQPAQHPARRAADGFRPQHRGGCPAGDGRVAQRRQAGAQAGGLGPAVLLLPAAAADGVERDLL
ncbi:MAG: hypothetical protein AVDCRST_MAG21-1442, partial [uncultured Nocardioidaceae bacterium]